MKLQNYLLQTISILAISFIFTGCGGERVHIKFKTSEQFFIDDSKTDADKLNRELEYDIRQAEKKRKEKQQKEEAAKAEAAEAEAEAERLPAE
ncbi:MAG: hypothetical protein A2W17_05395 [Planctomycetes bacterium RBG_16_41_13]|nr:MAG: hypothetical protein A2W17_05395 [Planctomycetes bacterium RBG_16_41_13]